ncbi:MAG: hypothetical protein Q4Q14_03915 [Methanobrevibacter sp.]|nr:hypothetical protein [Methanobrevibacter sp.]
MAGVVTYTDLNRCNYRYQTDYAQVIYGNPDYYRYNNKNIAQ